MRGRIKITTALFAAFVLLVSMLIPALKVFAVDTVQIQINNIFGMGLGGDNGVGFYCDNELENGSNLLVTVANTTTFEIDDTKIESQNKAFITVDKGSNVTFTLSPKTGKTAQLLENGKNKTLTNNAYTFSNVQGFLNVDPLFNDNQQQPGEEQSDIIPIVFNSGTINGNVITYNINNTSVTATVLGIAEGVAEWNNDHNELRIDRQHLNNITFQLSDNFDPDTMRVRLYGANNFGHNLNIDNKVASFGDVNISGGVDLRVEKIPDGNSGHDDDEPGENMHIITDATLVWNYNGKLCYHRFDNLQDAEFGEINYIKTSDITDQSGNNGVFDLDTLKTRESNNQWGWVETEGLFVTDEQHQPVVDELTGKYIIREELTQLPVIAHQEGFDDKSYAELVLYGVDPQIVYEKVFGEHPDTSVMREEDILEAIGDHKIMGISIGRLKFGEGNNSISYNMDNNFLMVIYDEEEYAAVAVSANRNDYEYFPEFWMTNTYNPIIDISGTTEEEPAYIEAYLANEIVKFENSVKTSPFTSVRALNVSDDAVEVTSKGNGKFEIKFNSNYYDRVEFEIKTATDTYYAIIARTAIQVTDNFGPGQANPKLIADVYYPTEGYDENSFNVVATVVKEDGTKKIYVLEASMILEDRFNVNMNDWGTPLGMKVAAGHNNKVSRSRFVIDMDPFDTDIIGAYFTVIGKDSITADEYAGTFSGSGAGSFYNKNTRKVDYSM